MSGLRAPVSPIIPASQKDPEHIGGTAAVIRQSTLPGMGNVANAVESLQRNISDLRRLLRAADQSVDTFIITDEDGNLVAHVGEWETAGVRYRGGQFMELYVGDAVGDRSPASAPLYVATDGSVVLGKSGSINVLDPYGTTAAYLGAIYDTVAITGAVAHGALIQLTVTGHPFATNDRVLVRDVGGVPNSSGWFAVTVINANTIDLQASVFSGTYTSGGTVTRLLHVTGAANSGTGLIRLKVAAHAYKLGDKVRVDAVGGVPAATGNWSVSPVDVDHFDLLGSTFAGTFTTGGTCLRYFAGGHFQRISLGPTAQTATLYANDSGVFIGKNGVVNVLDPYNVVAAKLGTESDAPLTVTGAVSHGGLIQLTIVGHGYEDGDRVNVASVGGVPNATGQWTIDVTGVNTFDLLASTFAGTFTTDGTCTRYFAGGLFQTFAIGASFPNYKLRAFADGSLRIKDAVISLTSGTFTIGIDAISGILVTDTAVHPTSYVQISKDLISAVTYPGTGYEVSTSIWGGSVELNTYIDVNAGIKMHCDVDGSCALFMQSTGIPSGAVFSVQVDEATSAVAVALRGVTAELEVLATGTSATRGITNSQYNNGADFALYSFEKARGTEASPATLQNNDYIGRISFKGYGTAMTARAAILTRVNGVVAADSVPTDLVFMAGSTAAAEMMRITSAGYVGIGTAVPTSPLQVVGLPAYLNNAAALLGGLTVGAFYVVTATNPAVVAVVT